MAVLTVTAHHIVPAKFLGIEMVGHAQVAVKAFLVPCRDERDGMAVLTFVTEKGVGVMQFPSLPEAVIR